MWPYLKVGGGNSTERDVAVVANLSARVSSIGDNGLGGWHSYRASKTALNQCMLSFFLVLFNFSTKIIIILFYLYFYIWKCTFKHFKNHAILIPI
jgi:hypothetical protein